MPPEVTEILAGKFGSAEKEGVDRLIPPHPLAQAMELRQRFAAAQVKHDLKPGDLCREKTGLGVFDPPRLAMFWRWLDTRSYFDRCAIAEFVKEHMAASADCIIAFIADEGGIFFHPADSQRLEPLPLGFLDEKQDQQIGASGSASLAERDDRGEG